MSNQIKGPFIAIKDDLMQCNAFDLYQKLIIAYISSYQRQGKTFFMSKQELAARFDCNWKTVQRRMDDLEKAGVIYRDGKVKRSSIFKVNQYKLHSYLTGMYSELNIPESPVSSEKHTSEYDYKNNNKTINKNSFIEEGDAFASSPSSGDIEALASEIDF